MDMTSNRLLLVGRRPAWWEAVTRYMQDNGFDIQLAEAEPPVRDLASARTAMVIIDQTSASEGWSLCQKLSEDRDLAIIVVGDAAADADRILCLELGADDYLSKPFNPRELLARVRAVLRRRMRSPAAAPPRREAFRFAGFDYDPALRELTAPGGSRIDLTATEAALLYRLLSKPRHILSREQLADGRRVEAAQLGRTIDLQISRLRKKLADHGGGRLIRTERGSGYGMACIVSRG